MKKGLLLCMLLISIKGFAQAEDTYHFDDLIGPTFENMFKFDEPIYIPEGTPPSPPVPLDGGLIALMAAGGAVAYKKYKAKKG